MIRERRDRDDKFDRGERGDKRFQRKRYCRFCKDNLPIDYKDGRALSVHITERGKILARRITGNCAFHQREVTNAIKRARILALLPFTSTQQDWV